MSSDILRLKGLDLVPSPSPSLTRKYQVDVCLNLRANLVTAPASLLVLLSPSLFILGNFRRRRRYHRRPLADSAGREATVGRDGSKGIVLTFLYRVSLTHGKRLRSEKKRDRQRCRCVCASVSTANARKPISLATRASVVHD